MSLSLAEISARCQTPLEPLALTLAERRVAVLMLAGWSNKQIAQAGGRAQATVKNQVASILRKAKRQSRAEFSAWIYGEVIRRALGKGAARVPQEAQPVTLR